jgi:hypothetical protein
MQQIRSSFYGNIAWRDIKPAILIMLLDNHEYHYWCIPTLQDLQWTQTFPVQLAFCNTQDVAYISLIGLLKTNAE